MSPVAAKWSHKPGELSSGDLKCPARAANLGYEAHMTWKLLTIVTALMIALCDSAAAKPDANVICNCADPSPASDAIDDKSIATRMLDESRRLFDDGKTTSTETLRAQLKDRRECAVALPAADAAPLSGEQVYERARAGVLLCGSMYKCDKCTNWHVSIAGGVALTADGVVATNFHVVSRENTQALVMMDADGNAWPVKEVLAADQQQDVAIVRLDGAKLSPLPLHAGAPVGSHVWVVSHPDGRFYSLTEGIISRYFSSKHGSDKHTFMTITADYAKGSSGGAVLDDRGQVVGMVASTTSIYYSEDAQHHKENLQMVVKQSVPAEGILRLIEKPR